MARDHELPKMINVGGVSSLAGESRHLHTVAREKPLVHTIGPPRR